MLVTRNEETARADADALGFENYALTFDEAVNNPEIDVIDICTPNICHYEEVKKAVLAGKHVLCEKPLGISAAEADVLSGTDVKACYFYSVMTSSTVLSSVASTYSPSIDTAK